MLRGLIVLLLLANTGYFLWTQGHLAPLGLAPAEEREPELRVIQTEHGFYIRDIGYPRAEHEAIGGKSEARSERFGVAEKAAEIGDDVQDGRFE